MKRQDSVMGDSDGFCEGGGDGSEATSPTTTTITATSSEVEHVVETVSEGNPVSGARSKKNLFKKIFMPWKWKAKRKTEKFKQRCTILERKISVKRSL